MKETRDWGFTPLLITGEMRSGTTLVANFLNSQEKCVVYADLLKSWFNEPRKLGLESLTDKLSERQRNVLLSSLIAEGWKFGISSFDDIERGSFDTSLGLYRQALSKLDPVSTAQVIGTKVTRQYEHLRELLDHGVKVIFCVRDPRDVLLSAKNRFADYNLFERADCWKDSIGYALSFQGHPDFYLLRFEDLLEEERRTQEIEQLSSHLEVPLVAEVEALVIRNGTGFVNNSSFGDVTGPFDQRALYRWKERRSTPEVAFASGFLRDEIENLGFESDQVDWSDLVALYSAYLAYSLRSALKEVLLAGYRRLFG